MLSFFFGFLFALFFILQCFVLYSFAFFASFGADFITTLLVYLSVFFLVEAFFRVFFVHPAVPKTFFFAGPCLALAC